MHIAAVGWIYVVLMMAITEDSVVAGIMTFLFYGVLPVAIIMYLAGTGNRKRRRAQELADKHTQKINAALNVEGTSANTPVNTSTNTNADPSTNTGSPNPN
jgi:hypothetical protein